MADERTLAALEHLVGYVEHSSQMLRSAGRPTGTQLAYGGGALEMLRTMGHISHEEMQDWFARVHRAAGGDDGHPLVSVDD